MTKQTIMAGAQRGDVVTLTAPTGGVTTGVPVGIGALLCIPQKTVAQTLPFAAVIEGVFKLPKATGVVFTEGQVLNWDASAANITSAATAAAGDITGAVVAAEAAASGATEILAKLLPGVGTPT